MKNRYFREIALLMAPFLVILGVALFLQVRKTRTSFIPSSTPVHAAFFGSEGEIVSLEAPAPTPKVRRSLGVTFARFNAKTGEKIAEASQKARVFAPALSPDGRWLASVFPGASGNIFLSVRDVKNGFYERAPLDTGSKNLSRLVWKRNSSELYLLRRDGAAFWSLDQSALQLQSGWKQIFGDQFPRDAAFSPNGKWVAFSSAPQSVQQAALYRAGKITVGYYGDKIRVCSWPNLKTVATLPGDGFSSPIFTNDGRSLLSTVSFHAGFSVVSAHIARLDLKTLKIRFTKIDAEAKLLNALQNAKFSPDGRILAAMNYPKSHAFYSVATGKMVGQTREIKAQPSNYGRDVGDFSRDGRQFLTVWPNGIEIHDLTRMLPAQAP